MDFALGGAVEEGVELIKLAMRDRIILVRVALGAAHRESKPYGAGGGSSIGCRLGAIQFEVCTGLVVFERVSVKAGRDLLFKCCLRQ